MTANIVARKRPKLPRMKTIGTIVREWRLAHTPALTTAALAQKVGHGVKRQNIEQLESGLVHQPRYLQHLARVMGYTIEDLLARKKPPPPGMMVVKNHGNSRPQMAATSYALPVPFVVWRRIGDAVLLENEAIEADQGPALLAPPHAGPRVKATVAPDDSIAPEVSAGTIVLVDPDAKPMDGDIVMVRMLDDTYHLRIYRPLAGGDFEVEATSPRLQQWTGSKHGVVVTAVVIGEYKNRRRQPTA